MDAAAMQFQRHGYGSHAVRVQYGRHQSCLSASCGLRVRYGACTRITPPRPRGPRTGRVPPDARGRFAFRVWRINGIYRRGCAGLWVTVRIKGGERDQRHKMLLTYLFYIDPLRYSHRESTRRNP